MEGTRPTRASRRDFVGSATRWLAVGAVAAASAVVDACALHRPTASFSAAFDVSGLNEDGESLVTPTKGPDGAPILIVRESGSHYVALSMQCTHEGCPVNPPADGVITCPCHGSQFDLAGRVRKGPAQFPLGRYDATVDPRSGRIVVILP